MRKLLTIPGIVILSTFGCLVMICLALVKWVDLTWGWVCDEWNA